MVYGKLINLRPLNYKVALKQKQYISAPKVPSRIEEGFTSLMDKPVKKDRLWFVLLVRVRLEQKKEQAQTALQSATAFHSTVYRGAPAEISKPYTPTGKQ